jgi:hypothetical protein
MRGGHLLWIPSYSPVCATTGAMTRKNRQKHRQFDRQFAPLPPKAGPASSPTPWSAPPSLHTYADNHARSRIVTVPVVAAGAGGRSRDTQDQGSQRRNQIRSSVVLSETAGLP